MDPDAPVIPGRHRGQDRQPHLRLEARRPGATDKVFAAVSSFPGHPSIPRVHPRADGDRRRLLNPVVTAGVLFHQYGRAPYCHASPGSPGTRSDHLPGHRRGVRQLGHLPGLRRRGGLIVWKTGQMDGTQRELRSPPRSPATSPYEGQHRGEDGKITRTAGGCAVRPRRLQRHRPARKFLKGFFPHLASYDRGGAL